MNREEFLALLKAYDSGKLARSGFADAVLSRGTFFDLGHAKVDTSRMERTGFPEVVYCEHKRVDALVEISNELYKKNGFVLLTRANREQYDNIRGEFSPIIFHERSGVIVIGKGMKKQGLVSVLSGGTSDLPVAEEAAVTAETLGCNVREFHDVGVAGIHRLLSYREEIARSNAVVAVAGMEGALPSVVGGLFGIPVIGVPTSVGYGTSFGGVTPLLTMLNSCAPGVSVVNIDNGFGAGYIAALINGKAKEHGEK